MPILGSPVFQALCSAAQQVYSLVQEGAGLERNQQYNSSGDQQLDLDILADEIFRDKLGEQTSIRYVVSEEQPELLRLSNGETSVALDPLDGSKASLAGVPSGTIFGLFQDVESVSDYHGANIFGGGFFLYGANLEVFVSLDGQCSYGRFDQEERRWQFQTIAPALPEGDFFAINVSNSIYWGQEIRDYYFGLIQPSTPTDKPPKLRWYASMVSDVKHLILQGGVFAYPADSRPGNANGKLRLVYEAIPMAYLVETMGGGSSDGQQSLLKVETKKLHQQTPVYLGEKQKISEIESHLQ